MTKYAAVIGRFKSKTKIIPNAYLIDYSGIRDDLSIKKFLLYLYKKGYIYYHLVKYKNILIEVRNLRERKKLIANLYYYGFIPYTYKAIISDTIMPNLSEVYKLIDKGDGVYDVVKVE